MSAETGARIRSECQLAHVRRARPPVRNGSAIQFCRHTSQEVCRYNLGFVRAADLREATIRARPVITEKDAMALAGEARELSNDVLRVAFKGSAMKRAKLAGLRRSARTGLERAGQ